MAINVVDFPLNTQSDAADLECVSMKTEKNSHGNVIDLYVNEMKCDFDLNENGTSVIDANIGSANHCDMDFKESEVVESDYYNIFGDSLQNRENLNWVGSKNEENEDNLLEMNVGHLIQKFVEKEFYKLQVDQTNFNRKDVVLKNNGMNASKLGVGIPRQISSRLSLSNFTKISVDQTYFENSSFYFKTNVFCNKDLNMNVGTAMVDILGNSVNSSSVDKNLNRNLYPYDKSGDFNVFGDSCPNMEYLSLIEPTEYYNETNIKEVNIQQTIENLVEKEFAKSNTIQTDFQFQDSLQPCQIETSKLESSLQDQISPNFKKMSNFSQFSFAGEGLKQTDFDVKNKFFYDKGTCIDSKFNEKKWNIDSLSTKTNATKDSLKQNVINFSENLIKITLNAQFQSKTCSFADKKVLNHISFTDKMGNPSFHQPLYIDTRSNEEIFYDQGCNYSNTNVSCRVSFSKTFEENDSYDKSLLISSTIHSNSRHPYKVEQWHDTKQEQEVSPNSLLSIANAFINFNENLNKFESYAMESKEISTVSNFISKPLNYKLADISISNCEQNILSKLEHANSLSSGSCSKKSVLDVEETSDKDQVSNKFGNNENLDLDIDSAINDSILKYENFTSEKGILATPEMSEKSTQTIVECQQNKVSFKRRLDFGEEDCRPQKKKMSQQSKSAYEGTSSNMTYDKKNNTSPSKLILFGVPCKEEGSHNHRNEFCKFSDSIPLSENYLDQSSLYPFQNCLSTHNFNAELLGNMEEDDQVEENISLFDIEEDIETDSANMSTESIKGETGQRFHHVPSEEDNLSPYSLLKDEITEDFSKDFDFLDWFFDK